MPSCCSKYIVCCTVGFYCAGRENPYSQSSCVVAFVWFRSLTTGTGMCDSGPVPVVISTQKINNSCIKRWSKTCCFKMTLSVSLLIHNRSKTRSKTVYRIENSAHLCFLLRHGHLHIWLLSIHLFISASCQNSFHPSAHTSTPGSLRQEVLQLSAKASPKGKLVWPLTSASLPVQTNSRSFCFTAVHTVNQLTC